jgi:predicted membrane channel-forming protein YqfA (hemolysin III family)
MSTTNTNKPLTGLHILATLYMIIGIIALIVGAFIGLESESKTNEWWAFNFFIVSIFFIFVALFMFAILAPPSPNKLSPQQKTLLINRIMNS